MSTYRYRHPCPSCGSIAVRVLSTGATEEDQPLRLRRCDECGHKFTTIEVELPVSFYRLDAQRKWRNRMWQRARRGYHGGLGGNPGTDTPLIEVSVEVHERAGARKRSAA